MGVLENGDIAVSGTEHAGICARWSRGVLERDNYTLAVSAGAGDQRRVAFDGAYAFENYEVKAECISGEEDHHTITGALLRLGMGLLEENRLKLEVQPVLIHMDSQSDFKTYGGVSYAISSSLTIRALYSTHTKLITGQVYYYGKI